MGICFKAVATLFACVKLTHSWVLLKFLVYRSGAAVGLNVRYFGSKAAMKKFDAFRPFVW